RTFGITRKTITQWLKKLLRQRVGCFVRETLSFSKKDWWHDRVTHWFIVEYNLSCSCSYYTLSFNNIPLP
ncbi:MAG: hypothetical protein OSB18_10125, partial [SAR324 cluster bacterium]|nr:hypothetical protein [SAR324 cluster bacterium]